MSKITDLRIAHLLDEPGHLDRLARWFAETWEPWYGPQGPGDARSDLSACASRERMPLCLIALGPGGELLGAVGLRPDSVGSDVAPGPWVTGFLVKPGCRGQGVGSALLDAVTAEAARLGHAAVFASTNRAGGLFESKSWSAVATSQSLRGEVCVYRRELKGVR